MEEKDVNSIANAVSSAIAKLNADTVSKEKERAETIEDIFICPECDAPVKAGITFCQRCGCELEWAE